MKILKPAFYLSCSIYLCSSCIEKEAKKPNFIIIQADDLGFDDLGSSGNKIISTPYLDQLADQSMQFSNFYVNPVCAPTRASFLTGRFFLRTGVSHVHGGKDFLNLNEKTIADVLKENGYATGMWGKWHSGHTEGYFPWQRGFEEAYMAELYKHENSSGRLNGKRVSHNKWADEVITDYAAAFITRNHDRGKPFFAYLSHLTCHSPLKAPESYIKPYREKGLSENLSTLYGMVSFMDHELGEFFHSLDSLGALENTYIFFMSDNGPAVLNDLLTDEDRELRYIHNYNGHKGNIWENGVKSPLFFYQKGETNAGTFRRLTDITDIFSTILDLAGVSVDHGYPSIDGKSFAHLIHAEEANDSATHNVFNYAHRAWQPTKQPWTPMGVMNEYRPLEMEKDTAFPFGEQAIYIRNQRFKLLQNAANYRGTPGQVNNWVLVDMVNDPTEKYNVYEQHPDVARSMEEDLKDWFSNILGEKGSFSMPVFMLTADGISEIPAKAPFYISEGLKNSFSSLGGWDEPGDYAVYKIEHKDSATYSVKLSFDNEIPADFHFQIYNQNDTVLYDPSESDDSSSYMLSFTSLDSLLTIKLAGPEKISSDRVWMKEILLEPLE